MYLNIWQAVVGQVVGHRPVDREVAGSILELGLTATVVSLSKKLYPHCSSYQNWGQTSMTHNSPAPSAATLVTPPRQAVGPRECLAGEAYP